MSKQYSSLSNANGVVYFYEGGRLLHSTDVVSQLQDLSDDNDSLRRRLESLSTQVIEFGKTLNQARRENPTQ